MAGSGASSSRKTRGQIGSRMSDYIGTGRDFLLSDVPTLRCALRKALLLQEQEGDKRNLPIPFLMTQVADSILAQWRKSNVKFAPPVVISREALSKRLQTAWTSISAIARGKAKKADKEQWEAKLDKLLDVTVCQCEITVCQGPCRLPGKKECMGHICCSCVKDIKVPNLELQWLYYQRSKVGEKSDMGMDKGDIVETKRQEKALARLAKEKAVDINYNIRVERDSRVTRAHFEDNSNNVWPTYQADLIGTDVESDSDDNQPKLCDLPPLPAPGELLCTTENEADKGGQETGARRKEVVKRNLLSVPSTAESSLRFDVSPTATAAICNGFLADLIRAGILPPESEYLTMDKCKLQRARKAVMDKAVKEGDQKCKDGTTKGIFFDGRKDNTLSIVKNPVTGRYHTRPKKESHTTITSEPDGQYRHHLTVEKAVHPYKPAYMEATAVVDWLREQSIDPDVLGGDSTNSNTGWAGGCLAWVEKLLGKKVFWVVCTIHCNELSLRHLIVHLVGKTKDKDKFQGPIGEKLYEVNDLERRRNFSPIPSIAALPVIPQDVVNKMSNDANLFYQLGLAITTGELSEELASRKCGTLVHSRWLTTATAILFLYCSNHSLGEEDNEKLRLLATFTLQHYHHMFWKIKVKHSIVDAPRHILTSLELLRQQHSIVRDVVTPYICSGAWFAHSEAVILALVCSTDRNERMFGVEKILEKRGEEDYGSLAVRPRRTPAINTQATSLTTLISWEKDVHEPVFTAKLPKKDIQAMVDTPFTPPYYPSHTQSTERAVRQVTEAAASVVGFQARHGFVLARQASRAALPKTGTKQDMLSLFSDL